MPESEIKNRKESWKILNEEVSKTRMNYNVAKTRRDSFFPQIIPILRSYFKKLDVSHKKYYQVLSYRMRESMTLEEVGKKMEVTRERIRQLEAKANEVLK